MLPHTFATVIATLLVGVLVLLPNATNGDCLTGDDAAVRLPLNKAARSNLYRGEQTFTLNMLRAINQTVPAAENVFFSPYSTYHALLLAYFGAQGQTEKELREALLLDWAGSKFEVYQAYRSEKKTRAMRFRDSAVTFRSVDKVYVSQSAKFEPCMQEILADEFEALNFEGEPEASRMAINAFVANVTDNNIRDVLQSGQITQATSLVLANAAFFKGDWQQQFDPANTSMGIFYATPERREFVPMMRRTGQFNHAVNERLGCHVLELPYVGEDTQMSMVILLPPNMPEALEGVLSRLTPDALEQALGEGMSMEVELRLPKFSFEKTYQLVSILNAMGIKDLFESSANLTSFSDAVGTMKLDDAVHKAKIQVDEQGSTAAAATVMFSFRSARPLEPAQFFCDHPFMFLIYDYRSSAVLFTGIYRGSK